MMVKRRIVLALGAVLPLVAHAACSATNGDAIPSQVFDASALDASSSNPDDPDGGNGSDSATKKDAPSSDAPSDAPPDAPNVAPVQINEIYVDNDGLGDGAEYVELRAAVGTPVDDLKLRLLHADGQVKYEVTVGEAGAKFGMNGLWVVGGGSTFKLNVQEHIDKTVALGTWGLDNARGAVQLVRGTTLLDVVGYGTDADAGALAPPASPPLATVEGSIAKVPNAPIPPTPPATKNKGSAFGRKTGAADTNDNRADFCKMEASPGYAQKPCL
jgi:hypothetical protein